MPDNEYNKLQRFNIHMYNKISKVEDINECRKFLLTRHNRAIENVSPTPAASRQHIKRASSQADIWRECLMGDTILTTPEDRGWEKVEKCQELISSKCQMHNLPYTSPCICDAAFADST
ncbi:hypothetical protein AVEN_245848-1 [Araneus ventricosus]|uniref:Uncharacterized protein n=1 Tax=Araneus ventricosus TaxID=182803 RepID=A0A4Y2KL07_ARAVE|nr:hypothetical protein AVEN_245848-1 [Araneus ventricosus]